MATIECPICLDNESEMDVCIDNEHRACRACMRTYVLSELKEKGNMHCPIPDCPDAMCINVLHTCLVDEDISVRQAAVLHYRRVANASEHSCDFCGGAVIKKRKDGVFKYGCQICAKNYCPRCKKEEHDGPCKEDKDVEEFAKSEEVDRCPNCGVLATKDSGSCNSVTCTQCGCYFAWKNRATLWSRESYGHEAHVWQGETLHQNDPLMAAQAAHDTRVQAEQVDEEARAFEGLQRNLQERLHELQHIRAHDVEHAHGVEQQIERFLTEETLPLLAKSRKQRDLPFFTVHELRTYCRGKYIVGYSGAPKDRLLRMILAHLDMRHRAAPDRVAVAPDRVAVARQIAHDEELARRLHMELNQVPL